MFHSIKRQQSRLKYFKPLNLKLTLQKVKLRALVINNFNNEMRFSQFYYSLIFKCLYFFEQISTRTALYLDIYTSRIFQSTFCPFF